MGDLINIQAAIDGVINLWADKPFGNPALVEIKDLIEALPSAEPRIVQCKDCIFRRDDHCDYVDYWIKDDDFCSRGEDGITWRT